MGKPFGSTKSIGGGGATAQSANEGFNQFLANGINQGTFGAGNFGNAINQMLGGQVGDPNSLNQYFALANNGNTGMMNVMPQVGGDYRIPQFQNPTGIVNPAGMAQSNYIPNNITPGSVNVNYNAPNWQQQSLQGIQLGQQNQFGIDPSILNSGLGGTAQVGSAGSADVNGQYGQAVQQILNNQANQQIGDLRARYGATGSGLGSNAQYAESNFRAQNTPQIAAALGQINQQERGLNLQQRQQDINNFYSGRAADASQVQNMMANAGVNLQGLGQNNSAILGMNSLLSSNNNAMNQFNQANNQFGANLNSQNQQFNNQLGFNAAQYNQQNQQAAAGMGLQAQGMNMDAINAFNQLMNNQSQYQNSFNQNNNQFESQMDYNASNANAGYGLQNQAMGNQYALGLGQLGLGLQGNQLNAQQSGIQALMQMLMQNQQLNTAQRQTSYQPGYLEQGMGILGQGANIASKFINPFSGMGNLMSSTPTMNNVVGGGGQYQLPSMPLVNQPIPMLPLGGSNYMVNR